MNTPLRLAGSSSLIDSSPEYEASSAKRAEEPSIWRTAATKPSGPVPPRAAGLSAPAAGLRAIHDRHGRRSPSNRDDN